MGKLKNFLLRTLTGLVFIAIIITSILWNPYSFVAVFLLITLVGLFEFYRMVRKPGEIDVSIAVGLTGGFILFVSSFLHTYFESVPPVAYSVYALFVIAVFLAELFRKKPQPLNNWAYFFLGQIYVALPFSLLNYIIFINGFQPWLLLALFITLWFNDTGAYMVGVTLGRNKLFERISPKKTWEGFIGGVLFALLSGYLHSLFIPDIVLWKWLLFGALVAIFGTLGDLSESLLKRTLNVKDSGQIMPGHGGILDRFDSMLLIAPMILIFYNLVLG